MYGIFTYIWVIYGVNVGKYTVHGSSGIGNSAGPGSVLNSLSRGSRCRNRHTANSTSSKPRVFEVVGCWEMEMQNRLAEKSLYINYTVITMITTNVIYV